MKRITRAVAAAALSIAALSAPATAMASAAPAGHAVAVTAAPMATASVSRATVAYQWALRQAGKHYQWGGTGNPGFDCSGLVMRAYQQAGARVPRTTYLMLASSLLHRTAHPVKGDLAFFGSGHVELYAGGHVTFGAHSSRDPVIGFRTWSAWWHPTAFYHVAA